MYLPPPGKSRDLGLAPLLAAELFCRGHGAMLIRLADVDLDDLADYLEDSYRIKAPRTLVRRLDDG